MKCLVCQTYMKIRDGMYGPFYYCPNGQHGTISVVKYKAIIAERDKEEYAPHPYTNMTKLIDQQCTTLGGRVTELEAFFIDNEAFYDNPDDFWQNVRPY